MDQSEQPVPAAARRVDIGQDKIPTSAILVAPPAAASPSSAGRAVRWSAIHRRFAGATEPIATLGLDPAGRAQNALARQLCTRTAAESQGSSANRSRGVWRAAAGPRDDCQRMGAGPAQEGQQGTQVGAPEGDNAAATRGKATQHAGKDCRVSKGTGIRKSGVEARSSILRLSSGSVSSRTQVFQVSQPTASRYSRFVAMLGRYLCDSVSMLIPR